MVKSCSLFQPNVSAAILNSSDRLQLNTPLSSVQSAMGMLWAW